MAVNVTSQSLALEVPLNWIIENPAGFVIL